MAESSTPVTARNVPGTISAAGVLVAIQAVGLVVIAGWLVAGALREPSKDGHATAWSTAGFLLAAGVLVGFLAYALLRGKRWTRGPVFVVELLTLPIGWQFLEGPTAFGGALAMVMAAGILVLLLTKSATAVFKDEGAGDKTGDKAGDKN